MRISIAAASAAIIAASPAQGQDPLAPLPQPLPLPQQQSQQPQPQPQPLPHAPIAPLAVQPAPPPFLQPAPVIVIPRDWRGVFAAINAGDWAGAQAGIASLPPSALTPVAKAELYTAKNSPTVDLPRLQALLAEAPDLPRAEQIARLALTRGATTNPPIHPAKRVVGLGSAPYRYRARPVSDPAADSLRAQLDPLIDANSAAEAEMLLMAQAPYLSADARAEAAQRVGWSYYIIGRDYDARRVADWGRIGASGEWGSQAAWVSGLASWRQGDCNAAARAFRDVAATATQRELGAGGLYWAARAEQACRRPQAVQPLLKAAAASPESFYGLIARETLGGETRLPPPQPVSTAAVDSLPNVRRAVELARIGERWLAEDMLRHQARIGSPADHAALIEVARRLNLAGAQYWLATNGQRGARSSPADRYPKPAWTPLRGWRIDPALAFGHALQESRFRGDAVSPAGAIGLMQVMPATASSLSRSTGLAYSPSNLFDPAVNMELGQSYIERMRASPATGGQLPKVIASYNAGPTPVARWATIPDGGDPLLWMESITYWETRYYIPAVMRNLWVYQGLAGQPAPTLTSLAQHRWPGFPVGR